MKNLDKILIFVIFIVILETLAIACVKEYHINNQISYFILAVFLYGVVCYFLHLSFYYSSMGITNVIWSGLSVFLVALAGVVLFKEQIHKHDIFAGILITAGILIFQYTD